jgi:hypothetical protein
MAASTPPFAPPNQPIAPAITVTGAPSAMLAGVIVVFVL